MYVVLYSTKTSAHMHAPEPVKKHAHRNTQATLIMSNSRAVPAGGLGKEVSHQSSCDVITLCEVVS